MTSLNRNNIGATAMLVSFACAAVILVRALTGHAVSAIDITAGGLLLMSTVIAAGALSCTSEIE